MIEQVQPVRQDTAAVIAAQSPGRRPFLDRVAHTDHTRFGCLTAEAQRRTAGIDAPPHRDCTEQGEQSATKGDTASRSGPTARRAARQPERLLTCTYNAIRMTTS